MSKSIRYKFHVLGLFILLGLVSFGQSITTQEMRMLLLNEEYNKIIETTSIGIANDSNALDLYYYQASAYRENYQFEKSIESCLNLLSLDSSNIDILKLLAKNYMVLKQNEIALNIYKELYEKDTNNVSFTVQLAKLHLTLKEYDKSKELYKKLYSKDSLNSYYCKQLGLSLMGLNDTSFYTVMRKAIELNPKDKALAIKLANKLNDLWYLLDALSVIDYVIPYNEDSYQLYKMKGYTHFLSKDHANSVKSFEKVLELGDTTRLTLKYIGYSYFETEDFEKSYANLKKVLEFDSTDTRVYFHLSIAARKLYKTEESINYMNKSFKLLYPSNKTLSIYYSQTAENYVTHGARLKIKGKFTSEKDAYYNAIENFELAYESDTTRNFNIYSIGDIYDSYLNEKVKALVYYSDYMSTLLKYPEESDNEYATRIKFVKNRIQKIREDLHFEDSLNE